MMSKRKPSILYSRALSTRVSIMSFSIMRCSLAVSGQQEPFFEIAVGIEAVIVAGHDLVEIGVGAFAAGVGVVEDDVLDDAQAGVVQALDHGAVFAHAIVGIDGVAAFGSHVVHGIVAPVVAVAALDGGDGGLLLLCRRADTARGRRWTARWTCLR